MQTRILVLHDWKIDQRNPDFFRSIGIFLINPKTTPIIAKVMPNSPSADSEIFDRRSNYRD